MRNKKTITLGLGLRLGTTSPRREPGPVRPAAACRGSEQKSDKVRSEKGKSGGRCPFCPLWLDKKDSALELRGKGPEPVPQLRDSEKRRGVFRRKHVCTEAQGKSVLAVNIMNASSLLLAPQTHSTLWKNCIPGNVQLLVLHLSLRYPKGFVPASFKASDQMTFLIG